MSEEKAFGIVVLGDSIQWGQGLPEELKFSELVRLEVERQLRRPTVLVRRYAQSGAGIGGEGDGIDDQGNPTTKATNPGSLWGELPSGTPTIHAQLNALLLDPANDPNEIDLVLVDGGINPDGPGGTDVFGKVLHPLTRAKDLRDDTEKACRERMLGLLEKVTAGLPNARVVVTGYYPIFSRLTYLPLAVPWLQAAAATFPLASLLGEALLLRLAHLSEIWAEASRSALQMAADEINQKLGAPHRVGYAHVSFGPENCIFAPKAWLWGLTPALSPEDPVAQERIQLCKEHGRDQDLFSMWASVGHPNQEGARQYYQAVVRTLRDLGVLRGGPSLFDTLGARLTDYLRRFRRRGGGEG